MRQSAAKTNLIYKKIERSGFMKEIKYLDFIFTQKYMITSSGEIFNSTRKRFLKKSFDKDGYCYFVLYTTKGARHVRAHRVVLSTFSPIDGYESLVVNHIDGITSNNNIENLEWCTVQQNTKHAYQNGLAKGKSGESNSCAKLKEKDVIEIKEMLKTGNKQRDIARKFNVSFATINLIAKGKTWSHIVN